MTEYCIARRVLIADVRGGQLHGRLRLMDGMKLALCNRGMTVEAA